MNGLGLFDFAGEAGDLGPGDDEAIVGQGFLGPAFSIAEVIEAVGEVSGDFASVFEFGEEIGGSGFTVLVEGMDQVLGDFPVGHAIVAIGVPVGFHFLAAQEFDFSGLGGEDSGFDESLDAGVFGFGEGFGIAVLAFVELVLFEPGECPAGVAVEFAFLFGEVFVEELVDELEGGADSHGGAVVFEDGGILGEDGHAGADAGLGEVYGGDVALLEGVEGFGEVSFEFGEELATGDFFCVGGAGAADKDDGGGEGVGIISDHAIAKFTPHWPSSPNTKLSFDKSFQHSLPSC